MVTGVCGFGRNWETASIEQEIFSFIEDMLAVQQTDHSLLVSVSRALLEAGSPIRSVTVLPITVLAITVKQIAHRRLTSHDCHAPLATNRPADLDPGGSTCGVAVVEVASKPVLGLFWNASWDAC